jgi:PAT family beta-lactamase induction signal transducer AmpG
MPVEKNRRFQPMYDRPPRPWHFFFLVLPYGASFGFVSGALPYIARQRGIGVDEIGAVVAAAFAPHALKFLWAPVVDVTWSRKGWYSLALALVLAGTFLVTAAPIGASSLRALTALVVISQSGLTLMGMACEGMIGREVPANAQGSASGWFQAGMLLGSGLGGGAGIELVSRYGGPVAGGVLTTALAACAWPLFRFDEQAESRRRDPGEAARGLGRDLWRLLRSPGGVAAVVICISPVGAGAAGNLFGAIADEWHASQRLVALTTGALGGPISAVGAIAGGRLAQRMNRRAAYALGGAVTAVCAVAMACAPHKAWAYGALTLAYQACNGAAFAAFSAMAFEIAGTEGVATKYNVLASLANTAISYTTRIDAAAHARWGGSGVLLADAAMTGLGIGVLAIAMVAVATRSGSRGA